MTSRASSVDEESTRCGQPSTQSARSRLGWWGQVMCRSVKTLSCNTCGTLVNNPVELLPFYVNLNMMCIIMIKWLFLIWQLVLNTFRTRLVLNTGDTSSSCYIVYSDDHFVLNFMSAWNKKSKPCSVDSQSKLEGKNLTSSKSFWRFCDLEIRSRSSK